MKQNPNSLQAVLETISNFFSDLSQIPEFPLYAFGGFLIICTLIVVGLISYFNKKNKPSSTRIDLKTVKPVKQVSQSRAPLKAFEEKENITRKKPEASKAKPKEKPKQTAVKASEPATQKLDKKPVKEPIKVTPKPVSDQAKKPTIEAKPKPEKVSKLKEKPEESPPEKPKAPSTPDEVTRIKSDTRSGWLGRLKTGLSKTRANLGSGIKELFSGKDKIDADTLENLHEILFKSDLGIETADILIDHLKNELKTQKLENPTEDQIKTILKAKISEIVEAPSKEPFKFQPNSPTVILIVGVNGVGKTTSIGKLAARFLSEEKKIILGAADTFRAAAIDQLKVWGDRLNVRVVHNKPNSDPAAVVFDSVKSAKSANADVLLIDTAGRLHNKKELMNELEKINRVIDREIPGAPHETWLVVDSTTGQNAHMQIKAFREVVNLTGLIVTKLDGTAKGGVVVGACQQHKLPIRYIGVGEKAEDLREFSGKDFADMML